PSVEEYTPHPRAWPTERPPAPERGRPAHGTRLKTSLLRAQREEHARRTAVAFTISGARPGLYVQFESIPGFPLNLTSLEDQKAHIEVVAVTAETSLERRAGVRPQPIQRATVFIPDGQVK